MSTKRKHYTEKWVIGQETLWKTKYLVERYRHNATFSKNIRDALLFNTPQEATICLKFIAKNYTKTPMWVEKVVAKRVNQLNEPRRWKIVEEIKNK